MLVKGFMYHFSSMCDYKHWTWGPEDPESEDQGPRVMRSVLHCIDCSCYGRNAATGNLCQCKPKLTALSCTVVQFLPKTLFTADSVTSTTFSLTSKYPALLPLVSHKLIDIKQEKVQLRNTRSQFAHDLCTLGPLHVASI